MTIVAALDFSTVTDRVFEIAAGLADSLRARIVLLHVVQPSEVAVADATAPEDVEAVVAAGEQQAVKRMARYERRMQLDKLNGSTIMLRGSPAPQIVEQSVKLHASLLVLGSHGAAGVSGRLVGETLEAILHRAPCPVVVVPHPKASRTRPPWL